MLQKLKSLFTQKEQQKESQKSKSNYLIFELDENNQSHISPPGR